MPQSTVLYTGWKKGMKRTGPDLAIHSAVEDPDQIQSKRQRLAPPPLLGKSIQVSVNRANWLLATLFNYFVCKLAQTVEGVATLIKLPCQLTSRYRKTSVVNGSPHVVSIDETFSETSDPPKDRLTRSTSGIEMLQLEKKIPHGKERVAATCHTVHRLRDICNTTRSSGLIRKERPSREHSMLEATASEASRMRRPCFAVEEGVQRQEKEKYKLLLEFVKEKYPRNKSTPVAANHYNTQTYSREPLRAGGRVEEHYRGVRAPPFVTLRTGSRDTETWSPLWSRRNDMISFTEVLAVLVPTVAASSQTSGPKLSCEKHDPFLCPRYRTPPRNPQEPGTTIGQTNRGRRAETDLSEEVSVRLCLGSASSSRPSTLGVKEQKHPSSEKIVERLPQLTEDMEREIMNALGRGQQNEILSSAFKLKVTRGDIQTLRNHQWLNDEVINFYMNLLVERNNKQGLPVLHAFSTFFYPKLTSGGYQAVRRWTKGVDIFSKDLILVPIHLQVHWGLVVIDVRRKNIKYFDSMGQNGYKICETLRQYLLEESKTKRNVDICSSEWTLYSMKSHEIPQQLNGSDCGMFTCKYADYISRDKPITFTQHQMPHFRRQMVWEILHQQLL
ncbi:sentrin-specific protease 2 isoform X2 [Alligator sinensis]|uniref:Sentrin-specific protease 2 isoform X2 n=1 Tax=Alligator sinensis TaxID=38654 RepID=A0A3Q0GA94_ALLSI|nr:sentrin-specific protease 2 isoform X2 [Alligator sinensis]XP_025056586.1 sentrin-specific protease 2 isoform X2 [Alligator sinensis]XP_025056587.1 sentrin-specific protease 2 isoform X2 [Alligator sinensis]XP_025056588.1 sentrin-specific protease 2 isoform X2 [Alligator sinensis]